MSLAALAMSSRSGRRDSAPPGSARGHLRTQCRFLRPRRQGAASSGPTRPHSQNAHHPLPLR
eukprot:14538825-Alexandrium_andersonii.AAC.1